MAYYHLWNKLQRDSHYRYHKKRRVRTTPILLASLYCSLWNGFSASDIYPDWKGDLFVGSLKFEYLERLEIQNNQVVKREKVLDSIGRVRNVEQGPDGYLYVGVEGKGILKIVPKP